MNSNYQSLEELLRKMYAEETLQTNEHCSEKEMDISETIDEEWRKFEAKYFAPKHRSRVWMHIAAAFITLMILSGIAYAAIRYAHHPTKSDEIAPRQEISTTDIPQQKIQKPIQDSVKTMSAKTFENVPLKDIVEELGKNYNVAVEVRNSKVGALRFYYPWNPQMPISKVIEELNSFEKVNITIHDQTLVVE